MKPREPFTAFIDCCGRSINLQIAARTHTHRDTLMAMTMTNSGAIPRAYIIHLSLHNCIRDISESHFPVGTPPYSLSPPFVLFDYMHVDGCLYYFAFFAIIFKQKHTKSICATIPQGHGDDDDDVDDGNEAKAKESIAREGMDGGW